MLSLRAVNQFYGENHILWNLDLELTKGECTCVLGAPGMGKTTLVNCITGYLPIHSGSMVWNESGLPPQDLLSKPIEGRAALGMSFVSQERRIFLNFLLKRIYKLHFWPEMNAPAPFLQWFMTFFLSFTLYAMPAAGNCKTICSSSSHWHGLW